MSTTATRAKDPIPTALTLLGVTPEKGERPSEREFRQQLHRVRAFRKAAPEALLPIEQPAALRCLDHQIAALEGGSTGFQRVPLDRLREVLGWRNEDGMPTLAPFSVHSDTFRFFQRDQWSHGTIDPELPTPLRGCYDDVLRKLHARSQQRNVAVRAIATFTGVIPRDVRALIAAAMPRFKDIRILAEVEAWKIEETELPSLRADPLVIGYDGEEFWLLAAFDITPLEEAVRQICLGNAPTAS